MTETLDTEQAARDKRPKSPKEDDLTPRQDAFAKAFSECFNGTQAAIEAGYSKNGADRRAYDLLRIEKVQARIQTYVQVKREDEEITADAIKARLWEKARANICDVVSIKNGVIHIKDTDELTDGQKEAIAEISETNNGFRVKMHDSTRALVELAKLMGMYTEKVEMHQTVTDATKRPPVKITFVSPKIRGLSEDEITETEMGMDESIEDVEARMAKAEQLHQEQQDAEQGQ